MLREYLTRKKKTCAYSVKKHLSPNIFHEWLAGSIEAFCGYGRLATAVIFTVSYKLLVSGCWSGNCLSTESR